MITVPLKVLELLPFVCTRTFFNYVFSHVRGFYSIPGSQSHSLDKLEEDDGHFEKKPSKVKDALQMDSGQKSNTFQSMPSRILDASVVTRLVYFI